MGTCTHSRASLPVVDFRVSGNVWSRSQAGGHSIDLKNNLGNRDRIKSILLSA